MSAIARWIDESATLVFSTTRGEATWQNASILPAFDADEIRNLKSRPGKDIMVFGSGSIVARPHRARPDRWIPARRAARVLGIGRPLIEDASRRRKLELLEATSYPSGIVRPRYAGGV